ncbi:uncharacterized protein LOC135399152 [Ornithodoros turicata]|uniref:uncharacterized protein LOC135399152 n=1 Tax=Ornithodoros turicata TaxID=34597 RepID=UPI00313A04F2
MQGCAKEAIADYRRRMEEVIAANAVLQAEITKMKAATSVLESKICVLEAKVASQQTELLKCHTAKAPSFDAMLADEKMLKFYTGFSSPDRFLIFVRVVEKGVAKNECGRPTTLTLPQQLVLVLSRLRVGLLEEGLAYRYGLSPSTVSKMCTFWVQFLASYLEQVPVWPSRLTVDRFMPEAFVKLYPTTRVILDCTELFIETPSHFRTQSDTYSSYKNHNTAKGLIGIAPNGMITFVSDLAPGRLSDKAITRNSGPYSVLDKGDSVMADRGFLIKDDLENIGVDLNIPLFLGGREQVYSEEVTETTKIVHLRIHEITDVLRLSSFIH